MFTIQRAASDSDFQLAKHNATSNASNTALHEVSNGLARQSGVVNSLSTTHTTKALALKSRSIDDLLVDYRSTEKTVTPNQSYQFKKQLLKNPIEVYSQLKGRLTEKSYQASFPEFEGVVEHLKSHLLHPFVMDAIKNNPFMESAHKLCMLALSHISFEFEVKPDPGLNYPHKPPVDGLYPFHATIGAIREVINFFDNLERTVKTNIPPLYHADRYTYHDQNLQFNPEVVEIPSECVFTMRDFVRIRSVPVGIMGVTVKTAFADSYFNSPRDFWVHDANHSRRLNSANQQYFERNQITEESDRLNTYKKWDNFITSKVMPATQILGSLSEAEKNIRKMVKVALFEFYHERALTPDRQDVLKALNFKPGGGSAFEIIVNPKNKNEHYENRRLFNYNIDSGTSKYQSDMNPRTVKYFHQTAPNIVTNLYDKLSKEFYDNRYAAINDLPALEQRTPELVSDALMRVVDLYDIKPQEVGLTTKKDMRQHFLNLARNHDEKGKPIGQPEIYHQKVLSRPALKAEVVEHILNNR